MVIAGGAAGSETSTDRIEPRGRESARIGAILVVTLVGAAVRVWMAGRSGLFPDEAQFLWIVRSPTWTEMIKFLQYHESHPPFYYALTRIWLAITGDSPGRAGDLSIIFGIALIPTIYIVGARMFSHRIGLMGALTTSLGANLVDISTWLRPYALLPWLCLLSVYFLWENFRSPSLKHGIGYVLTTLALMTTHNWSFFILSGEWVAVFAALAVRFRSGRSWLEQARAFTVCSIVVALCYIPWFPSLLFQFKHAGYGRPRSPLSFASFLQTAIAATLFDVSAINSIVVACVICASAIAAAIRFTRTRIDADPQRFAAIESRVFALGVPVAALIAAMICNNILKKYVMLSYCVQILGPLLMLSFLDISARIFEYKKVNFLYFVVGLLSINYVKHDASRRRVDKSDDPAVAAAVASIVAPADLVSVLPQWDASTFYCYYPLDSPRLDYPTKNFRGPIYYDRLLETLLDQRLFDDFKEELATARRDGRRIIMIMESQVHENSPKVESAIPATIAREYQGVAGVRAKQAFAELERLYGPPRLIRDPADRNSDPSNRPRSHWVWLFDTANRSTTAPASSSSKSD